MVPVKYKQIHNGKARYKYVGRAIIGISLIITEFKFSMEYFDTEVWIM